MTMHDLVIAMLVADKAEKGEPVSDLELRGEIAGLIHASVIHGRVDKDGKPTDLNGNDFQVNQTAGRVTVSTKFSFFQPIRSHRQADIKLHNKPAAGNAGSTPQVVVQHGLAGVPEPGR